MYVRRKRHLYNETIREHLSLVWASKFMIRRLMKTEEMCTNLFKRGTFSSSSVFYIFTYASHKRQSWHSKTDRCVDEKAWKDAFYLLVFMYFVHFWQFTPCGLFQKHRNVAENSSLLVCHFLFFLANSSDVSENHGCCLIPNTKTLL